MKPKWIGSSIGSANMRDALRVGCVDGPRRANRGRRAAGTRIGDRRDAAGEIEIGLVEAEQILRAGVSAARAAPRTSPESTLTSKPSACSAAIASSRCGNAVSGWQPRSITSAPAARILVRLGEDFGNTLRSEPRRSRRRCGYHARQIRRLRRRGRRTRAYRRSRRGRARRARRNAAARRSRSVRHRPGTITRSASSGPCSRLRMIASVMSAATFTPMSNRATSPAGSPNSLEHRRDARLGETAGQEEERSAMPTVPRWRAPAPAGSPPPVVSSKTLACAIFSRSMRRG